MAVRIRNCMRKIGTIGTERAARRFVDYLFSVGIESEAEPASAGNWSVWVIHDEQLDAAERELEDFLAEPTAARYEEGARDGRERFVRARKEEKRSRTRIIDVRTRWSSLSLAAVAAGPVTAVLMAASVLASIAGMVPQMQWIRSAFFITEYGGGGWTGWSSSLPEVYRGEVWRLITPIFLHFGIIHLFFNMMWLRSLGGAVETIDGWIVLILQVLVFGVAGNLAQLLWSGPLFGGMSGVVYGLFGYIWIRGKYDPASRLVLDRNTVIMMVVWFFLCLTGLMGPIANMAHAAGLVSGIAWASIRVRRIPFTNIRF